MMQFNGCQTRNPGYPLHCGRVYMLKYVSRWATPSDILKAGAWLGSRPAMAVSALQTGFRHVTRTHALVLLFVLDACLKYSKESRETILPAITRDLWCVVRALSGTEFEYDVGTLMVHWIEHGFMSGYDDEGVDVVDGFRCSMCKSTFVCAQNRDVHMDLHFHERYARFQTADTEGMRNTKRTWVMGANGVVPAPSKIYSKFADSRLQLSRKRVAKLRMEDVCMPCSPVPLPPRTLSCPVCGDGIARHFDDALDAWVARDCVCIPYSSSCIPDVVHVECAIQNNST